MRRVLVIEDEPGLVMALMQRFTSEGYEVETASDGEQGLAIGQSEAFDVIVLDVMLPRRNGFDVCRDLRQRGVNTPIIMLTARGQVVDRVVGLKLGADDYLTKPFAMMELLARIEALLRRTEASAAGADSLQVPTKSSAQSNGNTPGDVFRFGSVCVDFRRNCRD